MTRGCSRVRAIGWLSVVALALAAAPALTPWFGDGDGHRAARRAPVTAGAAGLKLARLYARWRAAHEAAGGDHEVRIALGPQRATSAAARAARGVARLDLLEGKASVEAQGLPRGQAWEVWLLDNAGGSGALIDAGDGVWKLGTLVPRESALSLRARLDRGKLAAFEVDAVVVVAAGSGERSAEPVLFGLPRAFQRIYSRARSGALDRYALARGASRAGPDALLERLATLVGASGAAAAAPLHADVDTLLSEMAAAGADLFLNETFAGNGRTCGTCHPPANNFTIDPAFIAALPASDPLFVAEREPALSGLEDAALLRSHALIIENVDGFDRPGVLRSVPHVFAMSQSLSPPICVGADGCAVTFPDGTQTLFPYGAQTAFVDTTMPEATGFAALSTDPLVAFPVERTGWSGDGAPGSGSLREFSIGAVIQHFPRTLARRAGVDFRLPTDDELDALELFQLSLGRLDDPDLREMTFKHPVIERGKQVFMRDDTQDGTVSAGKCQICHFNAGANSTPEVFGEIVSRFGVPRTFFGNQVFSTGVNDLPPDQTRAPAGIPRDGGMGIRFMGPGGCVNGHFEFGAGPPTFVPDPGTEPGGFGTAAAGGFLPTGFCIEQFNPPPLVEAADTAPFFHNNAFDTLEEAVAFYGSDTFNQDPSISLFLGSTDSGGIAIKLDEQAVSDVSHFLRALNALENLRQADELSAAALSAHGTASDELLDQAWEELKDARAVLEQTALHARAVSHLALAIHANRLADVLPDRRGARAGLVRVSRRAGASARREIIAE